MIKVRVPAQLRTLTGGVGEISVEGSTVGEVLKGLDAAHPGFAERIFDTDGGLRRFVNVFLDEEDVRFLDGLGTPVTDDEIVEAIGLLARTEGIFAETAGGVTIATLAKLTAQGVIRSDERVVAMVTGHGLKTVEALADVVGPTATIAPTLESFDEAMAADTEHAPTQRSSR